MKLEINSKNMENQINNFPNENRCVHGGIFNKLMEVGIA